MRVVRIIGSLLLGFLALGGFVGLPNTLSYFQGRPADFVAAAIDVGLPLGLAVGAFFLWPRKRKAGAGRAPAH